MSCCNWCAFTSPHHLDVIPAKREFLRWWFIDEGLVAVVILFLLPLLSPHPPNFTNIYYSKTKPDSSQKSEQKQPSLHMAACRTSSHAFRECGWGVKHEWCGVVNLYWCHEKLHTPFVQLRKCYSVHCFAGPLWCIWLMPSLYFNCDTIWLSCYVRIPLTTFATIMPMYMTLSPCSEILNFIANVRF